MTLFDKVMNDFFNDTVTYNYGTPKMSTTTKDGFHVELALPGFSKEDVDLEIDGRTLIISAEIDEKDETRFKKSFKKMYSLPDSVDPEKIEGSLEHGVLTLTLGKSDLVKKINLN